MLNIPRLRNVLKKLETSSDLAKFLIQRATAISKEYGAAAAAVENPPNAPASSSSSSTSSSSTIVTSLSKSLPPPMATATHTFTKSRTETDEQLMHTEQEKHQQQQQKTIRAAIGTVSLFSSTDSISGVAKVTAGGSNLRKQSSVYDDDSQTSYKMSDAKVKEMTQQAGETAPQQQQLEEENTTCNGTSCGSEEDKQTGSAKEKPCFTSSLADILRFMELVGNLKHTKRTGWVLRDVNDCESISGHMYRMSMMTFLLDGSEGLNQIRCMELALVHDLAESLVGDLTPFCGVAKEDKKAMELKAMEDICKLIQPRGKRIMELFEEYEGGESAESKFVKDLDRLDMVMQAFEYEKRDNCLMKHQEFFDSTEGKFQHPFVQKLVKEICDQRKALAEAKVVANGNFKLKTVTPNCPPCLEHKNERS